MTDSRSDHDSPDPRLAIYAELLGQVAEYGMAVIGVLPDPVEGAMGLRLLTRWHSTTLFSAL